ncbi:TerD domain protein [Vibrio phage 1.084.O._10N.261.49.F5]|nr:TerD domain protein [Vibrio phage 1.084.O._10N.261.49.F5]
MTINLSKNQTINLSKTVTQGLTNLKFGVNWGMINKKSGGLFGLFGTSSAEAVDLDASVTAFSGNSPQHTISFQNLRNSYIVHSGDDRVGDESADDSDNETITIDFTKVPSNVDKIFLYVNSFSGQKFDEIPYAGVRVYEGQVDQPTNVLAKFEIANDSTFKGSKTMILGFVEKVNNDWEFKTIGDSVPNVQRINETVQVISQRYL